MVQPAKCPIAYDYVWDKDSFTGRWNLGDLLPSWIISVVLFTGSFIVPVILINLGVWIRKRRQENQLKEKKEEESEESKEERDSDWDDEGIPYVTNMAEYLRTHAPASYLEKFIEKQKKNGPPVIRIPGKTTVAVQTETINDIKESKSKEKSREKSKEKKTTSREKLRTTSKSKEKVNEARSLTLQKTMSSLHESTTQGGSSGKKPTTDVLISDPTQESDPHMNEYP